MPAVDTHVHVFARGLKLAPLRRYAPEYEATIDDHFAVAQEHDITHAVLVQPSFLGTDNNYMCAALRAHRERLRGIAVVDPAISDNELDALQAAGVVGIRLNLDGLPIPQFERAPWPALLASLKRRDWLVEVHREACDLPRLLDPLLAAGLNVVVDHFGRPDQQLGSRDPGFRYLLEQAGSRRVWVKLSGAYRNGPAPMSFTAAPALAALLLEHFGPERLVWGSDWPHTRHESYIDLGLTRRMLDEWVPEPDARAQVLGATALHLFRF